jgi:dihydroneopterin aldolase/D-erythro-7,8-dihydroneopterin triphosphate epimerase
MDSDPGYLRTDMIHIRDLHLRTVIGINPEERNIRQDLILNLTMFTDQRAATSADDFKLTVDYKGAKTAVIALVEKSSFGLIESLAAAVADLLLSIDGVLACRVTVDKPGALRFARSVAVEIFREKTTAR